jgi:hypothetical protein
MSRTGFRFIVTACLILFAFGAAAAHADIYVKQKVHTGSYAVMGKTQPEKDEITEIWLTAKKVRTNQGEEKSSIILIDKGVMIGIDHEALSYSEMPLDFTKEVEGQDPQASAMYKGIMGSMSAKVTETAEKKKIGKWNCRKYLIEYAMAFGTSSVEAWATTDIKVDYELFYTASNAMLASQPGFEKVLEEMKKVKGVIVYQTSVSKAMGSEITTVTEVLEFSEKKVPAGTYDVPKGYKKVEKK